MAKKAYGKKMSQNSKAQKGFTPCSRCPNPRSCAAAGGGKGMCLAQAMS